MSGGRIKRGTDAFFEKVPSVKGAQDNPQTSVQTHTQNRTQIDTQENTQNGTQNSTQTCTQDNTQVCVQVADYLRPRIEHDLRMKIEYVQVTLRVEEDVGQALRALTSNADLPRGIQQAVANNGLRLVLEALGYLEPKGGNKN